MRRGVVFAIVVAFVVVSGELVRTANAGDEIARREGLACTSCHTKLSKKRLTSRGKYYELKRTVEGYDELIETFGSCLACHVRKPGSAKLTREGRYFERIVDDMKGLEDWLRRYHPTRPAEPSPDEEPESPRR